MVLTRGLNGRLVPRALKRLIRAFSVVELVKTEGARVVGVVKGNFVLLDPNPVKIMSSLEVVNGVSVLLPRLTGINGFLLGNKRLIRFRPRKRLLAREAGFRSDSKIFKIFYIVQYIRHTLLLI